MTKLFEDKWPWIEGTHSLRIVLLDCLTDAELAF